MTVHDPRLHAFRADLADIRLKGEVEAERFVAGTLAQIVVPVADMRRQPKLESGIDTQLLFGDTVRVFDQGDGWAWMQAERDNYVGYAAAKAIGPAGQEPTHIVSAPRTFVYPGPDLRFPRRAVLSIGSTLAVAGQVETRGTLYAVLPSGEAVIASHLCSIGDHAEDYVTVAENLLATPYLWGGASGFGIDCSGLVQLALRMTGRDVPRDSDMQAAGLGAAFDPGPDHSGLRRGDLVFWKGHVAIMTDGENMIHASGHTMLVSREGLNEAIARIGYLYGGPTGFRRP
jgi:cell wall-associated NlpC family hydrolase